MMTTDRDRHKARMKALPAEFFLPPQAHAALRRETVRLVATCLGFIVLLGVIVALTQGIVIKV